MNGDLAMAELVHDNLVTLIREMSPLKRRNFALDCARFALERTAAQDAVSEAFCGLRIDLSLADASTSGSALAATSEVLRLVTRNLEHRIMVLERGLSDEENYTHLLRAWGRVHAINSVRCAMYPTSLEAAAGAAYEAWLATRGKEGEAILALLGRYIDPASLRPFAASPKFLTSGGARSGADVEGVEAALDDNEPAEGARSRSGKA